MLSEHQGDAAAPAPAPARLPPTTVSNSETAARPQGLQLPITELPTISVGIRIKLIALIATTSLLIVGVLASYFPAHQISELRTGLRDRAATYGRLAGLQLRSAIAFSDQQTAREVISAIAKDPLVDGVAVYTENGTLLDSEGRVSELARAARRGFGELRIFYLPGRVLVTAPVKSLEGPQGTLVLELSTLPAMAARDHLIRVALAVGALAVFLGTVAAGWIARSLASRVERVASAAAAVARGDLEQQLDLNGPRDEIGILAHGFAAMTRRLRDLIQHIHDTAREETVRLEALVQERTSELDRRNADLRLVLDNVEQGFVTIDRDARVVGEHSRVVDIWLGPIATGETLWERLDHASPGARLSFEVAWTELLDGFMPAEVCVAQMPRELLIRGRHMRFEYKPLGGDAFEKVLVVISDATAVVERDRSEREERDILDVSTRLLNDRAGFLEFFAETQGLLKRIAQSKGDLVLLKRDLHTLKGNAALYGLSLISTLCHVAESELEVNGCVDCSPIAVQWERTCSKIRQLLGEGTQKGIQVDESEYLWVLDAIRRDVAPGTVKRMIEAWRLEPVRTRLERAAEQLKAAASRLGKGDVQVRIDASHTYLAREELADFWGVFSHVVRNAVVHGLDDPAERRRLGKSPMAAFCFRTGVECGRLFVELEDSGPGIDWERVRARASIRGLPAQTEADLQAALFIDGLSTTEATTELAGRGVGLSAVQAICKRQQGAIDVVARSGKGTKFRFSWPTNQLKSLVSFETGEPS